MALSGTLAVAEQTIGVQDGASATDAVATAKVNIRVLVPKIVILRVGDAANTVPQIDFIHGISGFTAPQASASYTGAIPPTFTSTISRTNPTGSDGQLVVGAWTNVTGTVLTCAISASTFAAGAAAGGAPGTADIVWTRGGGANQLPHPGGGASGNLTSCDGSTSAALTARTAYTGTYTYGSNVAAANVDAGTYSLTVTYTATAP
jgi:hypothetical protein